MTSRPPRFARLRAGAFAVIALVGLAAACEAHLPTSAEVEQMDARGAEHQVAHYALFDSGKTYVVDDVPVTREKALSIPASEIATITMRRAVPDRPDCVKNADGTESCTKMRALAGSEMSIITRGYAAKAGRDMITQRIRVDGEPLRVRMADPSSASATEDREKIARDDFKGLILIDGVRADPSALAALTRQDIVSVEVLKGAAAAKAYTAPEAANGVISVTTVHGKKK